MGSWICCRQEGDDDMDGKEICPILCASSNLGLAAACMQKDCEWWTKEQQCAMITIVELLKKIAVDTQKGVD